MLNQLGFFLGLIFLIAGVVLLYEGVSNAEAGQTAAIMGGATFLSLGSVVLWVVLKKWWQWRKEYRRYRNE